jgi:proline iminopeptidase
MTRAISLVALTACLGGVPVAQVAGRFVDVADGVRLFVQEEGKGTPVIAIHGGPGFSSAYLAPDLSPLSARFRMIFYDQRGAGRSTVVTEASQLTATVFVADLDRLRASLGIARVALVGHSWGAGLAALYAVAHPDRVERLVLVDAIPPRANPYMPQFQSALSSRFTPADQAALAAAGARRAKASDGDAPDACREYYRVFIKAYLADPASVARMRGDVCAAPPAALRNTSAVNRAVLGSLGEFDFRTQLSAVKVPALVVHGHRDPIPMEAAREWAGSLADARLLTIADSGHFPFAETPEAFFGPVVEFLSGRWPTLARAPQ